MDVETFYKKYQRKMWKSMISRKKLKFSIWDVIKYRNEKVYYMPYSGKHRFEVKTQNCLKCNKELEIGFRKNEFIALTCKCSADNIKHPSIKKLSTLFSEKDAKNILKVFADDKTRNFPNKLNYWIRQGYSHEDATKFIQGIQKDRSIKSPSTKKGAREYSIRTVEYWIKRGYDENEARKKVSEHQVGNGIQWYINRYGKHEGKIRYQQRMSRWIKSYNEALKNDPTINKRKMVRLSKASKQSLNVFLPIYEKYKSCLTIYLGIEDNSEYFLRHEESLFFYDFTIPELKIIIEFNGSKFHPNVNILTEQEIKDWKSLFSNESADVVMAKDILKQKIAEAHGYDYITIWDTDDINNSIQKIENLIKEKLDGT